MVVEEKLDFRNAHSGLLFVEISSRNEGVSKVKGSSKVKDPLDFGRVVKTRSSLLFQFEPVDELVPLKEVLVGFREGGLFDDFPSSNLQAEKFKLL